MLKRQITYTDYNDNQVTETFYFNISKPELLELQVGNNSLADRLKAVIDTEDPARILAEFKYIVLAAYGEKTDDGKRFVKSEELRTAFSQTAAYEALYMELATNDTVAAAFVNGILPSDIVGSEVVSSVQKSTAVLPPPPPSLL